MTRITRVSAALGSVLGSALVAQTAFAGPACDHAAKAAAGYPGGYSPALYQPEASNGAGARLYRMGMGYATEHGTRAGNRGEADIVDTAIEAGSFNTLLTAAKAAGLVDALKGEGPFTLFAPTDAAFAKLPKAQLDALLRDKAALTKVLTYHVVPGTVKAADVTTLTSVATVEGQSLTITVGDSVMVNNATVVQTDIVTSNGVIHVIDAVMLPPDMVSQF